MRANKVFVVLSICIGVALAIPHAAWSQAVPLSFVASPDVYKVIAENEQYRVVSATWKPGQRDNWHSHASAVANYYVTDCSLRGHTPDGKSVESNRKAGFASVGGRVPSHSVENIGKTECTVILFEPK